jgi:hypothetical protein
MRGGFGLLVAVELALGATVAGATTVRVRAGSRVEGRVELLAVGDAVAAVQPDAASMPRYQVVISGSLHDDLGEPVPNGRVNISCRASAANAGPATDVIPLLDAEPCHAGETSTAPPSAASSREYVIDADTAGNFCFRSMVPIPPKTTRFRFDGDLYRYPASIDLPADLARSALAITFEPLPRIVSLDTATLPLDVRLYRLEGAARSGVGLGGVRLKLTDELGRLLGISTSGADGRTHFDVNVGELREPGPGDLRVEVEVPGPGLDVRTTRAIERHAKVTIEEVGPTTPAAPEDSVRVRLRARWARGAVPGGAIEATIGRLSAGSAAVRDGLADMTMAFDASATMDSAMREDPTARRLTRATLRYLPDAPWWEPGEPTVITVALPTGNPMRKAPLALVALAIGAWMLRGSWQLRRREGRAASGPQRPAFDQGVILLTRAGAKSDGYHGQVLDAHEGTPIAAAVVSVLTAAFPAPTQPHNGSETAKTNPAMEFETDEHGRFSILATSVGTGTWLRIRAAWHVTLEQPLPQAGEVAVRVVSRRRHLLSRLVAWSHQKRTGDFDSPEPTPRQVANSCGGDAGVWAKAVEVAAFGPTPIDAHREHEVLLLEPSSNRPTRFR